MSTHRRPRRARSAPLKMREAVSAGDVDAFLGPDDNNDSDSSDGEGILVESPAAAEARALAADPAALREAYAREKQDAGSERAPSQMRKKSEEKGCGGTRPEARNKLLEPLEEGSRRLGLACCVAQGVIKYGSLRCMTIEKLDDYASRGKAVYEHLGPKSKPHVDFIQRLEAELKSKKQTRYFYSAQCHSHLGNVWSLLQRVEKRLSTAAPGAAQAVSDLSDEAPPPAVTPAPSPADAPVAPRWPVATRSARKSNRRPRWTRTMPMLLIPMRNSWRRRSTPVLHSAAEKRC